MKGTVIVNSLTGIVKAIAANGSERLLNVGDRIYVDEQIATGDLGTVTIEFGDHSMMDLGRNVQFTLDETMLSPDFDTKPNDFGVVIEEVQANQAVLLKDESIDPTEDLEPSAAGSADGVGNDGGFSFIQVEYAESRMAPVSGFETQTTEITVEYAEIIIPELLLDPEGVLGTESGSVLPSTPGVGSPPEGPPPLAAIIFTLNEERVVDDAPELIDGDPSKLLGFSVEPSAEDTVTSINIKGFPENVDPTESDWFFGFFPEVFDPEADYLVNFKDVEGPIRSSNGITWEVSFEVTGALPGEKVAFVIPVIPLDNVTDNVVLEIETTVENSGGGFTSSSFGSVDILFNQPPALVSDSSTVGFGVDPAAALPINSLVQADIDTPQVEVIL